MSFFTKVSAKLHIDTTQFVKNLGAASKSADKFSKGIARQFQQVNKAAAKSQKGVSAFAGGATSGLKDVARIVQGILISQLFYRLAGQIQESVKAVWSLTKAFEQSHIAFSGLLRDQERSTRLMKELERFAAYTPYTFEQSSEMGQRLLAYGFEAENLLYVMDRLSDASAASGKIDTFDRVGLAIGQIWTKGRLLGQEIRQLTEAGIPAAKILQEQLGLAQEDLVDIGRMNISADVAVAALLKGMEQRYGGAAEALSLSVQGLQSTIYDNFLLISKEALEPSYETFRNSLYRLRNTLDEWRAVTAEKGFGGLVREWIPDGWLRSVQLFVTHIKVLKSNLLLLYEAIKPIISTVGIIFMQAINLMLPPLQMFLRLLLGLIWAAGQYPVVRFLAGAITSLIIASVIAKALLALRAAIMGLWVTKMVAQGVIELTRALRLLAIATARQPLIALFALGAAAMVAFALSSDKVRKSLSGLGSAMYGAFGFDTSKTFVPTMEDNVKITDEFNQSIGGTSEGLKDAGDEAKKAGKKAKQALLAFDEVFTINEPDSGAAGGIEDEDFTVPELEIPAVDFPMPEFGDQIESWVGGFTDALKRQFKDSLIGAGIGALIGGLLGSIIAPGPGSVIGAKIGAAAGSIVGFFYRAVRDWVLKKVDATTVPEALAEAIATIFFDDDVVRSIGDTTNKIVGEFWNSLKEAFVSESAGFGTGAIVGGIIGTILAPGMGTVIGAALGAVTGKMIVYFWSSIKTHFKTNLAGAGLGGIVGGLLGTLLAPGAGTAVGMAIGAVVGSIVQYFWTSLKGYFTSSGQGVGLGAIVGGIIGTLLAPGAGTVIGAALGATIGQIVQYFWASIKTWWANSQQGVGLGGIVGGVLGTILAPGAGTAIGAAIGSIIGGIVSVFWGNMKTKFYSYINDGGLAGTLGAILTKMLDPKGSIGPSLRDIVSDIVSYLIKYLKNKLANTKVAGVRIGDVFNLDTGAQTSSAGGGGGGGHYTHAKGGIFNKEHIASFAEGGKAEAILPVENPSAMAQVRRAIFGGEPVDFFKQIAGSMQPAYAGNDNRPIIYVQTMIAGDDSLRELERKMQVVRLEEDLRRG